MRSDYRGSGAKREPGHVRFRPVADISGWGKHYRVSAKASIVATVLLALASPGSAQVTGAKTPDGCIDVSDVHARVTIVGRLIEGTFRGPYRSEKAFILELPQAICIDDGGDFADPTRHFSRVHVSATSDALLTVLRTSVGREVRMSGEGFASHTGHHHAPLVVLADEITVR